MYTLSYFAGGCHPMPYTADATQAKAIVEQIDYLRNGGFSLARAGLWLGLLSSNHYTDCYPDYDERYHPDLNWQFFNDRVISGCHRYSDNNPCGSGCGYMHDNFWHTVDSLRICLRGTIHHRDNNLSSTSSAGVSGYSRHCFNRDWEQPNLCPATRHMLTMHRRQYNPRRLKG